MEPSGRRGGRRGGEDKPVPPPKRPWRSSPGRRNQLLEAAAARNDAKDEDNGNGPAVTAQSSAVVQQQPRNPRSLETMCVEFVAAHCEWVESWTGMAEHLARQVFTEMVRHGHADSITGACIRFKPFLEAFGSLLQSRVNFLGRNRLLNELSDVYELLGPHLTFMDLSGCALGSAHPILTSLIYMPNLLCLVMSGCRLNDDSLLRITLPLSMLSSTCSPHRGLQRLIMLDISHNPLVTERSLPKIKAFRCLRKINVAGTGLCLEARQLSSDRKSNSRTSNSSRDCGNNNNSRDGERHTAAAALADQLRTYGLTEMAPIPIANNGWIQESGLWDRWVQAFPGPSLPPKKRFRLV